MSVFDTIAVAVISSVVTSLIWYLSIRRAERNKP